MNNTTRHYSTGRITAVLLAPLAALHAAERRALSRSHPRRAVQHGRSGRGGPGGRDYNDRKGSLSRSCAIRRSAVFPASQGRARGSGLCGDVWVAVPARARPVAVRGVDPWAFPSRRTQHHFGPELQFGCIVGDFLDNQVLIIKTPGAEEPVQGFPPT